MAKKIISNEEINALMQAVQDGQVSDKSGVHSQKEVKLYDFARPDKFSKEQIRTLEMIHANCSRGMTTQLSTLLRSAVEIELKSIHETSYLEFFESMRNPATIALLSMEPLAGRTMVQFDPEIAFILIDRMLGGPGRVPASIRELTEIEKGLMGRIVNRIEKCITDAWSTLATLSPKLEMIIGSTLFSQIAMPDDRIVLVVFEVKLGSCKGSISFGIPVNSLDPVLSKLNAQQWFSGGRLTGNDAFRESISDSLGGTSLDVTAVLGTAQVSVRDLLDLQIGDLVCLGTRAGADISMFVGSYKKFIGQPGQIGRRLGLRITRVLNGEE